MTRDNGTNAALRIDGASPAGQALVSTLIRRCRGWPRSVQWDEWLAGWHIQRVPWVAFGGHADAHEVRDGVEDLTLPTEERAVVPPCCYDDGRALDGVGDRVVGGGPDDVVPSGRGGSQVTGLVARQEKRLTRMNLPMPRSTDRSTMRCNVGRYLRSRSPVPGLRPIQQIGGPDPMGRS